MIFIFAFILISSCKKDKNSGNTHCDDLVNDMIPADDKGRIEVASAFTPNEDGINDLFRPRATNMQSISVKLYNSESKLVFHSDELNQGWHVTYQIEKFEKFYYRIEGVTLKGNKIAVCGEVYAFACMPSNMSIKNFSFEDMLTSVGFTGVSNENIQPCN